MAADMGVDTAAAMAEVMVADTVGATAAVMVAAMDCPTREAGTRPF